MTPTVKISRLLDQPVSERDLRVLAYAYRWPVWGADTKESIYYTLFEETLYALHRGVFGLSGYLAARAEGKPWQNVLQKEESESWDDFKNRVLGQLPEILMAESL